MAGTNSIQTLRKTILYTNTTTTNVGFLPPKAIVIGARVIVTTAFNNGGTDLIDIGVAGTANNIANDVDVSSAGVASVTLGTARGAIQSSVNPSLVTAIYAGSATAASAGSAEVIIEYIFKE